MRIGRASLCIALVSFAVLLFEITVTRILSVVLWYHWAFLAVSLAMLGLGAPGVWFALKPPGKKTLVRLLQVGSLLLPLSVIAVIQYEALMTGLTGHTAQDVKPYKAVFCMLVFLFPMLCMGAVVCILLLEARGQEITKRYGADLLGACVGAVCVIPALHVIPTPQLTAGMGVLTGVAACIYARKLLPAVVVLTLAFGAAVVDGSAFKIRYGKQWDESNLSIEYVRWSPMARLAFFDDVFWRPDKDFLGWGMGSKAPRPKINEYWMEQDGGAGTPVTQFDGDKKKLDYLSYDVTNLAHAVMKPQKVVVIGAGGGRDILSAYQAGAKSIHAVEINPYVVETVSERYKEFSGNVYGLPGVTSVVSEGRSFLTNTDQKFDLIQISMIDSWAATSAGAFTLSENNLYTREAYRLYWDRLSDNGVLSTTRWLKAEIPRLIVLCRAALRDIGVEEPDRHLLIVGSEFVATVLMCKQPVDAATVQRVDEVSDRCGFYRLYPLPDSTKPSNGGEEYVLRKEDEPVRATVQRMVSTLMTQGTEPFEKLGIDLSAPTDDRPFFFQFTPVLRPIDKRVREMYGLIGGVEPIVALQQLAKIMLYVTLALFFLPFLLFRWIGKNEGFWRGSGYFACIGVGFLLVEIPWLQRFILFLGHPSYATTVVLAALLLGAGVGSMQASRFGVARLQKLGFALPVILAMVNLALGPLFDAGLGLPVALRILVSALVLVPIGYCMGMFFPLGMVRFGEANRAWFWAMNGAFSVVASVASLILALTFGFAPVVYAGIACYVVAWLLLRGGQTAA